MAAAASSSHALDGGAYVDKHMVADPASDDADQRGNAGPMRQDLRLELDKGASVKEALRSFAEANGWQLQWDVDGDYTLTSGAVVTGSIARILETTIRALNAARGVRHQVTLYHGNNVARIHK